MNLLAHLTDEAVLPKPEAIGEHEEIGGITKAVIEVIKYNATG